MARNMAKCGRNEVQADGEEDFPSPKEEGQKSTWKDGGLELKLSL